MESTTAPSAPPVEPELTQAPVIAPTPVVSTPAPLQPTPSTYNVDAYRSTANLNQSKNIESDRSFCCQRLCLSFVLILLTLLALACVIVGALIPQIIWSAEKSQLKDKLILNNNEYPQEQWAEFLNRSTNCDYYIWNLTNLNSLLIPQTSGSNTVIKPNFQLVGPINLRKWYTKFNLTYNNDGSLLTYYEARNFEVYDNGLSLLDQTVIVINPIYLGAIAQIARLYNGPIINGHETDLPGFNAANGQQGLSETLFSTVAITNEIIPELYSQLLVSNSSLISSLQVLAIRIYFNQVLTNLTLSGFTQTQILGSWSQAIQSFQPPYDNFVLPAPITQAPQLNLAIFLNSSNPGSFTNINGIVLWLGILQGNTQAIQAVMAYTGATQATIQLVAEWMSILIPSPQYSQIVIQIAAPQFLAQLGITNAAYVPNNWVDIALLQYGTGLIISATTNGLDSSIVQVLGASAGLLASINVAKAPEVSVGATTWCIAMPTTPGCTTINSTLLTINQTRSLLNTINNNPVALGTYLQIFPIILANPSPANTLTYLKTVNVSTSATIYYLSQSFINNDASNIGLLYNYFLYLSTVFTGIPSTINPNTGLTAENNGLFIKQTIRQVLFGINADGSIATTAIAPVHGVTLGQQLQLPGRSFQSYLDDYYINYYNRTYIVNTGATDITQIGLFSQYQGTTSISTNCDINDPFYTGICKTDPTDNDWSEWQTPEVLSGTYDNFHSLPLGIRGGSILETLPIFIVDVNRNVDLIYTYDSRISNIDTRGYTLDQRFLFLNYSGSNSSTNPYKNDNYYTTNAPDGLIWNFATYGGVPLTLSQPHMYQVDPIQANKIIGNNPSQDTCTTSFDIDPITGLTLQAKKRLQSNFFIQSSEINGPFYNTFFNNIGVNNIYIPYYYVDEHDSVDDDDSTYLKNNVLKPLYIGHVLFLTGIIAGSFFVLLFLILLCIMFCCCDYNARYTGYNGQRKQSTTTNQAAMYRTSTATDLNLEKQNSAIDLAQLPPDRKDTVTSQTQYI